MRYAPPNKWDRKLFFAASLQPGKNLFWLKAICSWNNPEIQQTSEPFPRFSPRHSSRSPNRSQRRAAPVRRQSRIFAKAYSKFGRPKSTVNASRTIVCQLLYCPACLTGDTVQKKGKEISCPVMGSGEHLLRPGVHSVCAQKAAM